jgi:hypothetical protein
MLQTKAEYYNNGHGWRIGFDFQGARRVLTVQEAQDLRDNLSWALEQVASHRPECRCQEFKDSTMACPLHGPGVQGGG